MPVSYLETGVLYCDDNLPRLASFPAECVDLIYLDPPFFSNRQYEVIWGDEAEVRSFEDRWEGGIQVYVNWMRSRVREMYRILKPSGSIYLHCDPTASHYLKVMMDSIFGMHNFRNEVSWKRSGSHNDAANRFGAVHDVLLFYTKSDHYTFNRQYVAHDPEYLEAFFRHTDPDGRRYKLDSIISPNPRPNLMYDYKGYPHPPRGWSVSPARMEELDRQGRLMLPANRRGRIMKKVYLDELPGMPCGDVWTDIKGLAFQTKERLGYPTQKPEALLARIIKASSNEGDVVLDPFCGCGTAVVAAYRLDRQWVGIDISPTAVNLMKRRLEAIGLAAVKLVGMPVSVDALRRLKPFEFQNWVIQRMNGTHAARKSGDMGIDGFSFMLHEPIQVKQSDSIGRNVVDNFETAVQRNGKQKGYIVGFSFTKGAVEEAARAKAALGLEIELVRVSDLLRDVSSLITPVGGHHIATVPLPPPRPRDTLPAATDLVASDRQTA